MAALGDKVTSAIALMAAQTREDLRVYRNTFPGWVANATDRGLLNWVHDRAWSHLTAILDDTSEVSFVDKPPTREMFVGTTFRLRIKKHDIEGEVATYPTEAAMLFMTQPITLEGLDEVHLIAGYRWDSDSRQIGAPVVSLRDGDNLVWIHELDEPTSGVVTPTPMFPPVDPSLPNIVIDADADHKADDAGEVGGA